MQRDVAALASETYDVIVVGGGITGACVARDAALRGLRVALVEKNDFSSATSGASSKLIHGGVRYLKNLEFGLVRESLRERRTWANVAPHMLDPVGILMPTRGHGLRSKWALTIFLATYDLLSYDRNRVHDPDKRIGNHRWFSRERAVALEPGLAEMPITGGRMFYDYQMHNPDRLELECLLHAAACGARLANHAEVTEFIREGDRILGVTVRDLLDDGATHTLRGEVVINAAGPWADIMMGIMEGGAPARQLVRSKGIHLITRPLTQGHAIAVEYDNGHFFIVPWRGRSLIGTTDTLFKGAPDECCVTEEDIVAFLELVNRSYPAARLKRSDVEHFYAGLRPIVDDESKVMKAAEANGSVYRASRAAEVLDHAEEGGLQGVITAVGGKWTTSRALAEEVVDRVVRKLGLPDRPCKTETTSTHGGEMQSIADYTNQAVARHDNLPADAVAHLVRQYGTRVDELCELIAARPEYAQPLASGSDTLGVEVVHAVRNEMGLTLEDVLFRRTGAGTLGHPGDAVLHRVADLMGEELHWDESERAEQLDSVLPHYAPGCDPNKVETPA
jgi:glycerol-3-phosphate dehydrogenase